MNTICHWGHISDHSVAKPCELPVDLCFEDSGLAYRPKHYAMAKQNRDWLLDSSVRSPNGP